MSAVPPIVEKVASIRSQTPAPGTFGTRAATSALTAMAAEAGRAAADLEAITPPPAVQTLHHDLITDAQAIQTGLTQAAAASRANHPGAAQAPLAAVSAALRDIAKTSDAIGGVLGP